MKNFKKKLIYGVLLAATALILVACSSDPLKDAKVVDVMNGSKTEVLGQSSIIKMKSEEVTDEFLLNWMENYVNKNNFNWSVIVYTDKGDDSLGVYETGGFIQKDVNLEHQVDDGSYVFSGETPDTKYYIIKDGKLLEQ